MAYIDKKIGGRLLSTLLLCGVFLFDGQTVSASAETSDARTRSRPNTTLDLLARDLLNSELQSKYPQVTRWSVEPLLSNAISESVAIDPAPSVQVTRLGGRSAVRISWLGANGVREARTVWFAVRGFQPMLTASRALRPHTDLVANNITVADGDAMSLSCLPLSASDDYLFMRTKRGLRAGSAICHEEIEPRPAVVKGENVTVRYRSDRVSITTKGIAQKDAHIGEKLRVTNPNSNDSFFVIVSAAREVRVYE